MTLITVYSMAAAAAPDGVRVLSALSVTNPYANKELRPLDGRHPRVQQFVLEHGGRALLETAESLVLRHGILDIGFRCVGGRHRSVALAEQLTARLRARDHPARVVHLDLF